MSSSEEYLDSLLRAALNGEQNTDEVLEIDKMKETEPEPIHSELLKEGEETSAMEMAEDPNRALGADEIAALFAQTDVSEAATEEQPEEEAAAQPEMPQEKPDEPELQEEESDEPELQEEEPDEPEIQEAIESDLFREDEEQTTENSVAEENLVTEETSAMEMAEDPNRALGADEIAALFAQTDVSEVVAEKQPEEEEEPAQPEMQQEKPDELELQEEPDKPELQEEEPNEPEIQEAIEPELFREDEEQTTEDSVVEENLVTEETSAMEMAEDPNRALGADEIAALFAQADVSEVVAEEQPEEEEEPDQPEMPEEEQPEESPESILAAESLDEPLEIDLENDDDLDLLLGLKEKPDMEDETDGDDGFDIAERTGETGEDVDSLLESMAEENEDLQEIGELLQKLDNNELILDDLEESISTDSRENEMSTEEQQDEGEKKPKKEKRGFSFFKKKEKKSKEKKEKKEDLEDIEADVEGADLEELVQEPGDAAEELLPEDLINELELEGAELDAVSDLIRGENLKEKEEQESHKEQAGKKKSFLSKLFDALTEEIPEEEEQETKKEQDSEIKGKKAKNDKKGKKGKKAPVTDASDNEGILEELDAESAASGKGKGKKKGGKRKKEKAEKEKSNIPTVEQNEKKLPIKMVIRIFALCLSVMAFILVVAFVGPEVWSLADARNAFYKQDYEKAYFEMTGRNLSDSDQRLYEKTKMILQLSHKYEAYESYEEMGLRVKALDSLLSGYGLWQQLGEKIAEYDAVTETDAVKLQILDALQTEYQITEEDAQTINGMDDYNYTLELEKITGESGTAVQTDLNSEIELQETEETEDAEAPAEDVLSEEEIK